jgi:hypothetical protein
MLFDRRMILCTAVLLTGCNFSSTPTASAPDELEQAAGFVDVTFYIAGMNQRLKIL